MSLIFLAASSVTATVIDTITDAANNRVLQVNSALTLRSYTLPNMVATTLATGLTNSPAGLCLINSASAVIPNFNVSTVDFVELSSGYKQAVAGSAAFTFQRPQLIAADPASGIALAVSGGRNLVKITASPQTVTKPTAPLGADANATFECIILKNTGAWLVGTQYGYIYELNASGVVTDQYRIPAVSTVGTTVSVNLIGPFIGSLAYGDNLLVASTDEGLHVIDWTTKQQIKFTPYGNGTTQPMGQLSNMASGVCLAQLQNPTPIANTMKELDITCRPLYVRDSLQMSVNTTYLGCGINPNTGVGWNIQSTTGVMTTFQVVPRASTLRTFTAQIAGIDQKCRLALIDDTGGAGNNFVCFDTLMQSPATYRVPTGKTIIEFKEVNDGTTALWSGSSYST